MKTLKTGLKTIPLWLMAIIFMAAQPAESKESIREIEEIEEVKLYLENKRFGKEKSIPKPTSSNKYPGNFLHQDITQDVILEKRPKYILYGNLTFYL